MRRDLPVGVMGAQLIHAAGESFRLGGSNTFAIALAAKNENHLAFLEQKLTRLQIPHVAVREPDAPWNNALMAIGIHPVADKAQIKPVTSGLRLLK